MVDNDWWIIKTVCLFFSMWYCRFIGLTFSPSSQINSWPSLGLALITMAPLSCCIIVLHIASGQQEDRLGPQPGPESFLPPSLTLALHTNSSLCSGFWCESWTLTVLVTPFSLTQLRTTATLCLTTQWRYICRVNSLCACVYSPDINLSSDQRCL